MSLRKLATILIVALGGATAFAAPVLPCTSVAEYRTLLDHINKVSDSDNADFNELLIETPSECRFEVSGKPFRVSMSQVQSEISAVVTAKEDDDREDDVEDLKKDVERHSKALDAYERSIDPTAGPKLKQIFTRKEFRRVGAQDTDAIVREQMMKLMIALFSLIAKNPEQAAWFAKIFTWSMIALISAFVLWKLYRWVMAPSPIEVPRDIIPFAPSHKSWHEWMRDARAALANGELREAVHSSYWAAISHLESSGAWTPDKARTPREYLRLISMSNPARPLLAEISRTFEVVWYGERIPAKEDCEAFLARVEQIACR